MTKFSIKDLQLFTLAEAKMMVMLFTNPYDSEYLHMCFIEYAGLTDGTSISAFLETKENMAKPSFI